MPQRADSGGASRPIDFARFNGYGYWWLLAAIELAIKFSQ
jgi:hypothetical protein